MAAAALLLSLALLTPGAAARASAEFTTGSTLALPLDSNLELSPQAIYVDDAQDLAGLTLRAPRVTVHVGESSNPTVGLAGTFTVDGPLPPAFAEFELTDVTLRLDPGSVPGFLGVYPRPESRATLVSAGDLVLTPQATLHVGDVVGADQGDDGAPFHTGYGRAVPGPVLDIRAGGLLTYEGPGVIKLNGPSVLVEALENATPYKTGRRYSGEGPVRNVNESWMVIRFDEGALTIQHPRMQVAAAATGVGWTGVAVVTDMRGEMTADDATYTARGQSVTLEGTFDGVIEATSSAGGRAVAAARLEGDLAHTSLAPASSSRAPAPAWRPLGLGVLLGVAAAVGVSGAVAYGLRRQRPAPAPELTAEQYRDLADAAMENLRFADALEWIEKAQELAPASARLWMDKGYCHASLGDVPEALAAYERAAQLSSDGEADLLAASLLLRAGEPDLPGAERHVERALQRSPAMAIEVQLDSVFDALRERPRVSRALRRALGERA